MAAPKTHREPGRKWPREVWIRGRCYRVDYVPHDHPSVNEEDGGELLGCVECRHCRVFINTNQAPASMRDTVVHELIHAYYHGSAMPRDEDTEEDIVEFCTALILELEHAGILKVNF